MKIKPEDYAILEKAVRHTMARTGLTLDNYTSLGLTAKRFRWDMLEQTKLKIGDGTNIIGDVNIYAYADDTHIDTALRKITRTKK